MTCTELCEKINGKILSGNGERELKGCYIGDLLSLAMSKVEEDNLWITIQSNINIVAVASLTDAGCILICDGFSPDENALKKAIDEDIAIITTDKSAYETAIAFHEN